MHKNTVLDNLRVHSMATVMLETALLYGAKPERTIDLGKTRIEIYRLPGKTLGSRRVRNTERPKAVGESESQFYDEIYTMPFSVPEETTDQEFIDWYEGRSLS